MWWYVICDDMCYVHINGGLMCIKAYHEHTIYYIIWSDGPNVLPATMAIIIRQCVTWFEATTEHKKHKHITHRFSKSSNLWSFIDIRTYMGKCIHHTYFIHKRVYCVMIHAAVSREWYLWAKVRSSVSKLALRCKLGDCRRQWLVFLWITIASCRLRFNLAIGRKSLVRIPEPLSCYDQEQWYIIALPSCSIANHHPGLWCVSSPWFAWF